MSESGPDCHPERSGAESKNPGWIGSPASVVLPFIETLRAVLSELPCALENGQKNWSRVLRLRRSAPSLRMTEQAS